MNEPDSQKCSFEQKKFNQPFKTIYSPKNAEQKVQ